MLSRTRPFPVAVYYVLIVLLLTSCMSPIHVVANKDFNINTVELKDKIPMRAGLSCSEGFRKYTLPLFSAYGSGGGLPPAIGDFFIGDALCSGSKQMLSSLFTEVVLLDQKDSVKAAKNNDIDIYITPELEQLNLTYTHNRQYLSSLRLQWRITTPDGKLIYSNTIKGEGIGDSIVRNGFQSTEERFQPLINIYMAAINDEFKNAKGDLHTNAWWKKPWWKTNDSR